MKKLYRKGTVHPSPPTVADHLSLLPAALLTLAAVLPPQDKEVLAYLISCSGTNTYNTFPGRRKTAQKEKPSASQAQKASGGGGSSSSASADHPPSFNCDCFRCYTSYWVRWDSSPNRQLIHEVIDKIEDDLARSGKTSKNAKKDRKKKGSSNPNNTNINNTSPAESSRLSQEATTSKEESEGLESVIEETAGEAGADDAEEEAPVEKGPARRFWGWLWGQD